MKKKRIIIFIIVFAILMSVVIAIEIGKGITGSIQDNVPADKSVIVYPVSEHSIMDSGYLLFFEASFAESANQYVYLDESLGMPTFHVEKGQEVRAGDVLLTYDTEALDLELERAENSAALLEMEYEAVEDRLSELSVSAEMNDEEGIQLLAEMEKRKKELDAELEEISSAINQAKENLEKATVRAEQDGFISALWEYEHGCELSYNLLITVNTRQGMTVTGTMPESCLPYISEGDVLSLHYCDDYAFEELHPGETSWSGEGGHINLNATITDIRTYPEGEDAVSGESLYRYYAEVKYVEDMDYIGIVPNPTRMWFTFPVRESSGHLFLEKVFVTEEKGVSYVWMEAEDGTLVRKEIETGIYLETNADYLEIIDGISKGDYLAFPDAIGVKEGVQTERDSIGE